MLKKKLRTVALLTAGLAAALLGAPAARANSIEVGSVTTTLTAGVWDYAYSMSLSANNSISATNPDGSSMFIFYDVYGLAGVQASFISGTTATSDWNIVFENTSGNWANGQSTITAQGGSAVENDLAAYPNVRFQYVGAPFASGTSDSSIGTAHLFSTLPPGLYGQFAARWVGITGNTQINTQSPLMPVVGVGAVNPTPLPSAAWMGVGSIVGLAFFARARRRAR